MRTGLCLVGFYERKNQKETRFDVFYLRLLIDKQEKECYNNAVIDNDIII